MVRLDFSAQQERLLRSDSGVVELDVLDATIFVTVREAKFEFDQASRFDLLALAVEHFMTRTKGVAFRRDASEQLATHNLAAADPASSSRPPEEMLHNGPLMRVFTEAPGSPLIRSMIPQNEHQA